MNPEEQLQLIRDLLLSIAPKIAQRAFDKLSLTIGDPYSSKPAEGFEEARGKIFDQHAGYGIELASRLAGKFAQISDAALSAQAQDTSQKEDKARARLQAAASFQGAGKSAADILSQPSGLSSETLKLQAMRDAKHRGPSHKGQDRPEVE